MPDFTYTIGEMFVTFYPNNTQAEKAWLEMAKHSDGTGKFLIAQKDSIIQQLRQSGYSVTEQNIEISDDDLLSELFT